MFESAKEHGAESVEAGSTAPAKPGSSSTFKGNAYKLGHTEDDSEMVKAPPAVFQPKEMDVVLKLWQNGFSIDAGPLRLYQDPQNQEFLASIKKGEVPRELVRLAKGGEVNVNMEDHRGEEFSASAVKAKPFEGAGQRLGSPADPMAGVGAIGVSPANTAQTDENSAKNAVAVDEKAPTTNLQLRLADGSRMVAKFNHTHTVADVRNYIVTARPQYVSANFVLLTTFPNKELSDPSVTLKDGNLLNAVIVQRIR
ncbi:hypothetical protein CAPTEDRAFT_163460 [Capitella teleta]|uniref:NSFL1 cofactor p47 n=1 Tax=Capitella teleta TaxID=283909 RepID=R7VJ66_CAPTE|nr:hypothetical protein CAPTEDRAFT_163460 [Capitella teleta]|eukprot:ELU16376.1 hypothetical protein CAPTEDRAFT_163460 [Capitella teleta]